MQILLVLFKSGLPTSEVQRLFKERTERYRSVKGLIQKFYVRDEATDRVGGIYIFDSKKNLEAFRSSDLAKSIGDAFKFVEPPTRQVFDVVLVLREEKQSLR